MDEWFFSYIFLTGTILLMIITSKANWYQKILLIMISYIILTFLVSRIIIPRLGFRKSKLPKKLPKELKEEIKKLKGTKEEVLKKSYEIVTERFVGGWGKTLTEMRKMMWHDLSIVWKQGGYAACNTQNYFLRLLLIKSKAFKEEEIKIKHQILRINIHQYLAVKLKKGWVVLDPWAKFTGIPFGRRIDYKFKIAPNPKKYQEIFRKPELMLR